MALVEVARFHTLSEAEIAASLLRSAGITASIADAHYGSVFWLEQKALGGFRLSVGEADLADSLDILRHRPAAEPLAEDDVIPPSIEAGDRVAAAALLLTAGPAAGWLVAGRRRFGFLASTVLWVLLIGLAFSGLVIGLSWIGALTGL